MKIGILGAMLQEVELIKELMVIDKETSIADRTYYSGHIGEHKIVLTFSRWGKVASSSTTTTLINFFEVESIIFMGVAGAVSPNLNIGDVVVGNGFYQHDMDARPFFDQYHVPLASSIVFEPCAKNVAKAMEATQSFLSKINHYIPEELLQKYSIIQPIAYEGLVASGDKFVSAPSVHQDLSYTQRDSVTLAVEMEGAAVAQVCTEHNIPYLVIRTISDRADHSAAVDFQGFVDHIASHYSAGIVQEYLGVR